MTTLRKRAATLCTLSRGKVYKIQPMITLATISLTLNCDRHEDVPAGRQRHCLPRGGGPGSKLRWHGAGLGWRQLVTEASQ